jgi:hypothetical protein
VRADCDFAGTAAARAEVAKGVESLATVLKGSRHRLAPFSRFPYLADTRALRQGQTKHNVVILDVDTNTHDYYEMPPSQLRRQAIKRSCGTTPVSCFCTTSTPAPWQCCRA